MKRDKRLNITIDESAHQLLKDLSVRLTGKVNVSMAIRFLATQHKARRKAAGKETK